MKQNKRLGWIKLHRKIINWQWFNEDNMVRIFLYLVVTANPKPTKFDGVSIKRGQIATSVSTLRNTLNISTQSVRTCLKRLKATNEITIEVTRGLTNRFSVITVCKYDNYQGCLQQGQQTHQQTVQQTNQHYHLYNNKEEDIKEEGEIVTPSTTQEKIWVDEILKDKEWLGEIVKMFSFTENEILTQFQKFENSYRSRGKLHKSIVDLKSHFVDWLKKILKSEKENTENERNGQRGTDRRRGMEAGLHATEDFETSF